MQGDWNGDGVFDQRDIVAALAEGGYSGTSLAAIAAGGVLGDEQTSIVYNRDTGELALDAPAHTDVCNLYIDSAACIFTGEAARNLSGVPIDTDCKIFTSSLGFGSLSFGNVAQAGLSEVFVRQDLTVVGAKVGGGDLGDVDLVYQRATDALRAGDANGDATFDQHDLAQVLQAGKYLTGEPATWEQGDWNGDGAFDQRDVVAALSTGAYRNAAFVALAPNGVLDDDQTSLVYDPLTGEIAIVGPAGREVLDVSIDSAAGIFTGEPARNLGGSFDSDTDWTIFRGAQWGWESLSFGNVAQTGLSLTFLLDDLTVVGSLLGGGGLGDVDLVYVCPNAGKNLAGTDFSGADLTGDCFLDANLAQADFTEANLTGVPFRRAVLTDAVFADAVITESDFSETTSSGFASAQLYGTANYQRNDLQGIGLEQNDLSGWSFTDQDLTAASLSGSRLSNADFTGAIVTGADFGGVTAQGFTSAQLYSTASYQRDDLHGIRLSGNDLSGWDLGRKDLSAAQLSSGNLSDTILAGADLTGASLVDSQLTNANLTDSIIRHARLGDATARGLTAQQVYSTASYKNRELNGIDLAESNLTEWVLANQDLAGATLNGANLTGADLHTADLREAQLRQARLDRANLAAASLSRADMWESRLVGADLTDANLSGAALWNANVANADFSRADLRGSSGFAAVATTLMTNTIWPDGQIQGLRLEAGQDLIVRDHGLRPIVFEEFRIGDNGRLSPVLTDAHWTSTFRLARNVVPQLGGTLSIRLDASADAADSARDHVRPV